MKVLCTLFVSIFLCISSAQAQCSNYDQTDRGIVKQVLVYVNGTIARSKEISYLASIERPIVNLGLITQRAAFANEYTALMSVIDWIGVLAGSSSAIRPRTQVYLSTIVSTNYLGLSGTTLSGATQQQAEQNSTAANQAATQALNSLWLCF